MADIALIWKPDEGTADIGVENGDLIGDDGIRTAILISLFTDGSAKPEDVLPEGETSRRGWWGDVYPEIPGDKIGSRLWLIDREKATQQVAEQARDYARDALQWMLDDKVAESIVITPEFVDTGFLGLKIVVKPPDYDPAEYRFNLNWQAEAARV